MGLCEVCNLHYLGHSLIKELDILGSVLVRWNFSPEAQKCAYVTIESLTV